MKAVKGLRTAAGADFTFTFTFTSDLKSTWGVFNIKARQKHEIQCMYCDTLDLSRKGAMRKLFPDSLWAMDSEKCILDEYVFCFLHAWLCVCSQRMEMLYNRTKQRPNDKNHTEVAAKAFLKAEGLRGWTKTKRSTNFLWLTGDDVGKIVSVEEKLARWEGISPCIWEDVYELMRRASMG